MLARTAPEAQKLKSIVVPCLQSDIAKLADTLAVWLSDRCLPSERRVKRRPVLILVFNQATPAELTDARNILAGISRVKRFFSDVEVHSANLDGDMDLYVRNSPVAAGRYGNKAGPNFLFQRAMHLASRHGGFTFQMELDCLPIVKGWMDRLEDMLVNRKAWVVGTPYLGDRELDRRVQFHVNGNALYNCGSHAFLDFLDDVWIARLNKMRSSQPNLAYDCWWSFEMTRANAIVRNESWNIWQQYALYFHLEAFLLNLNVGASELAVYLETLEQLRGRGHDPLFFHGPGIANLIATLASNSSLSLEQGVAELNDASSEEGVTTIGLADLPDDEGALPSYPSFIVANTDRDIGQIPRVLLGEGTHHIEGPSNRFYPVRYVWTGAQEFEIVPFSTDLPIPLMFRSGGTAHMTPETLPEFTATQDGRELTCTVTLMDHPVYAKVTISADGLETMKPIQVTTTAPMFEEEAARKRQLGILLLETGVKFAKF